jgi:hypothetical protein
MIPLKNKTFLMISVAAIYSVSAVDRAIYSYRFDFQLIGGPYIRKI